MTYFPARGVSSDPNITNASNDTNANDTSEIHTAVNNKHVHSNTTSTSTSTSTTETEARASPRRATRFQQ